MIWALLILAALLVAAVLIAVQLAKSRAELAREGDRLRAEVAKRDRMMKAMEAANAEASRRKDSMATGTDAERFASSLDVLHDIAGKPPAAAPGLAGTPGATGKRQPG